MKMVLVEWVDSAFMQGWMLKEQALTHKFSHCTSIGFLVSEDKEQVTIVQSESDKDSVGDGLSIPKCSIKKIRNLK